MKKKKFTQCAENYICFLQENDCYTTAHVHESALNAFIIFAEKASIPFKFINRDKLKQFEIHLEKLGRKPNTISTYMRSLRCIYNKGVESGDAVYIPRLFRDVYTGVESLQKKALTGEDLQVLLTKPAESEELQDTQAAVNVMFQCCGMAFTDLAHLKRENIKNETLEYHRKKSGTPMKLEILSTAKEAMDKIISKGDTEYLFPFLSGLTTGLDAFVEYRSALSKFNRKLGALAKALGLAIHVTSYSIRHSFATALKRQGVPIEMISELLGHKSIKTTQIYLSSFSIEEHTKINKLNVQYACNYGLDRD